MQRTGTHENLLARLLLAIALAIGVAAGGTRAHADDDERAAVEANNPKLAAALEELEASGWIFDDPSSPKAVGAMLDHLSMTLGESVAYQDALMEKLGLAKELAALEELAGLKELGGLDLARLGGLALVELMPDQGGVPGGDGGCWLCPGAPSGDGIDGYNTGDGDIRATPLPGGGQRAEITEWEPNGRDSVTAYGESDAQGNITAEGVIQRYDGWTTEQRTEYHADGSSTTTVTRTDPQGHIKGVRVETQPPPKDTSNEDASTDADAGDADTGDTDKPANDNEDPKKDLESYQPADGTGGGGVCPLFLEPCRRAAQELARTAKDPRRLISGSALVNPGPERDEQPEGTRLPVDSGGLVVNPDPHELEGAGGAPRNIRYEIPVLVLPPRPGS